jgi:hypothetical protein
VLLLEAAPISLKALVRLAAADTVMSAAAADTPQTANTRTIPAFNISTPLGISQ